ncbi:MAG TPA: hypothetical protein VK176_09900 [Phycisphaerales bacterium]|nr:hypothetical protein [Phycisphaerales bacterium]
MASSSTRNNILAGTFLLSSVVLAVLASFVLSDLGERMRSTNEYIVRFSIAQGATGIKAGSPVLLGGQPVGKVSGVEINKLNGQPGIDINVLIDAKYQLFDNAMVFLEKPLLGSLTSINIASMGSAAAVQKDAQIGPGPELAAGERIAGAIAPPSFLADAGLGTEQVMDFKQIIAEAKLAVEKINSLIDSNEELVTATLADIRGAAGDARVAVKDVTDRVPAWTKQVDSIITSIDTTAADFPGLRDTARDLLNDGRGLVGDSRALIGENREQIDRFIDNIDASAITLRDSIEPLATKARQAMDSFESLSTRLDTIVASEAPSIRRTLANARLASDQLKLTLMEVRAQPWRLLVQPDTKELQQQLLYDSARSYASAVSDLRAATESLDSMIERGAAGPDEVREIADRRNELEEAFKRYREAEKKMFEQFERSGK